MDPNKIADMLEEASRIRGSVITGTIVLEGSMNLFLARHFCSNSPHLMDSIEMIFATNKFQYESKRDTIYAILKKHPQYNVDKTTNEDLYEELKVLANRRNIFAHSSIDVSENAYSNFKKDKTIKFLKYTNSESVFPYSPIEISNLLERISKASKFINAIK